VLLFYFADTMIVILLADAERTEWYALVQTLISKCLAEKVQAALIGVLGEYERDKIERVRSSEFCPSMFGQPSHSK
jgi:hypothetical protein